MTDFETYCEAHGSFMQSERWAQVKKNWQAEYIIARRGDQIVGTMLILVRRLPLLHSAILYAPRGPVCDFSDEDALRRLMAEAEQVALLHNACFLKIDPPLDEQDEAVGNLSRLGFIPHTDRVGYDNIQCRENYILPLAGRSPDELMSGFKPKWRYNIRLSQRRGVTCGFYREEKLDDFCTLMAATAERDRFQKRDRAYFDRLLRAMGDHAGLCMTYLDGEPLSGALWVEYGGTFSYVYGCSSGQNRSCMPNYLMQWRMIRRAAEDGCALYDFGGVPYWYDETHRNYGVYRFKRGFGGSVKTYIGELDKVYHPRLYHLYNALWWLKKHV